MRRRRWDEHAMAWHWSPAKRYFVLPYYLQLPRRDRQRARVLLTQHPEACEQATYEETDRARI